MFNLILKVWICFCLSLISYSAILSAFHHGQLKTTKIVQGLLKFFLQQPTDLLAKINKNNLDIFYTICIWLLCSTILTHCFNTLLLKSYFRTKSTLTAETLEDIVSNKDLFAVGREGLREIKATKPEIFDILDKRLNQYEKQININSLEMPDLFSYPVLMDVWNQKVVLILKSYSRMNFQKLRPDLNIFQSKHGYTPQFCITHIVKSHSHFKQIFR